MFIDEQMLFELTPDERQLQDLARDFADRELGRLRRKWSRATSRYRASGCGNRAGRASSA